MTLLKRKLKDTPPHQAFRSKRNTPPATASSTKPRPHRSGGRSWPFILVAAMQHVGSDVPWPGVDPPPMQGFYKSDGKKPRVVPSSSWSPTASIKWMEVLQTLGYTKLSQLHSFGLVLSTLMLTHDSCPHPPRVRPMWTGLRQLIPSSNPPAVALPPPHLLLEALQRRRDAIDVRRTALVAQTLCPALQTLRPGVRVGG